MTHKILNVQVSDTTADATKISSRYKNIASICNYVHRNY